jgi:Protein of unknown function (DUF1580)
MIALRTERPLSLAQAAKLIPPTRLEKRVHVSTLVRWILRGVRGVKLEAARVGGRWITSQEALERFSAALTAQHISPVNQPSSLSRQDSIRHQRVQERVEQELSALGI